MADNVPCLLSGVPMVILGNIIEERYGDPDILPVRALSAQEHEVQEELNDLLDQVISLSPSERADIDDVKIDEFFFEQEEKDVVYKPSLFQYWPSGGMEKIIGALAYWDKQYLLAKSHRSKIISAFLTSCEDFEVDKGRQFHCGLAGMLIDSNYPPVLNDAPCRMKTCHNVQPTLALHFRHVLEQHLDDTWDMGLLVNASYWYHDSIIWGNFFSFSNLFVF